MKNITYYNNDMKYKKYNNTERIAEKLDLVDTDTLNYRLDKCSTHDSTTLDISHLGLTKFPTNIPKNIEYLFCSENKFEQIDNLGYLKNLKVFDCSSNNLKLLPELSESIIEIVCIKNNIDNININKYKNLKRLDVSHNNLVKLENLNDLEILICKHNKLTLLPSSNNIKKIICTNNLITNLGEYKNLEILDCCNNKITKICNYQKLLELYCKNNNINSLNNLDSINVINIERNDLTYMPYLKSLIELGCSNIKIPEDYKIKECIQNSDNTFTVFFDS